MSGDSAGHRPEVRMSHAEREVFVDRLKTAQAEGRLELHEFEERVGRVYAARFASDVDDVLSDLPAAQPPPPRPQDLVLPTAPAVPLAPRTKTLVSVLGSRKVRGRWAPGPRNRTITVMGSQTLDLTEVEERHVDIEVFTMMGDTKIIVPPGAIVQTTGFIFIGETKDRVGDATIPVDGTPMRVRVRVRGLLGECTVRTPGAREALGHLARTTVQDLGEIVERTSARRRSQRSFPPRR